MKRTDLTKDIAEIESYVRQLSASERKMLLKGLRKKILLKEAQTLSQSVNKDMKISMDEILRQINIVRTVRKRSLPQGKKLTYKLIDKWTKEK